MKKIFLCPLLLFIVSNAQAQDQCQEQYTYSCSVVSDPSEEERQQGITTGGEWIKCVPVDENILYQKRQ